MFNLALEKAEEWGIKFPTSAGSSKNQELQKNIYFCFIDYAKALTVWVTKNCEKFWKRWEYQTTWPASWETYMQEATVRTGHGTMAWFQIGKGVHQGCILSLCLFNFYEEYIMRNAVLEEAQAGIKIAGRNINNLRYADNTTLMASGSFPILSPPAASGNLDQRWRKSPNPRQTPGPLPPSPQPP